LGKSPDAVINSTGVCPL